MIKAFAHMETELGKVFAQHLTAINSAVEPEKVNNLWQDIAIRYNENQRAYHSLQHIEQLFAQFEQIKHVLNEPHIIALALFYHDVIYEPTRSDNELKSAEYAVEALRPYFTAAPCQHIYALIMMTANHELADCSNAQKNFDAAYLLDMDLSILGASWTDYEQYAQAVRQEYAYVSNPDYRDRRRAVLTELLAHPKIYLTDYYYDRLEKQARQNIKREIKILHAS
ncbi:HD domain-containing protein [Psychrobacter faecalis]|uniref:HD domain-containing protein n=1 Tax=Psychrobacter faecalis TaxID=180588 RepID=UPI001D11CE10|nr:hypothetical protein [Psychrobacter faecalis]